MTKHPDLSTKSDEQIGQWIQNHEDKGVTDSPLFFALLEERARRGGRVLKPEASLAHLTASAKAGIFTTYGDLAKASDIPWNKARHLMNGAGGHLDQLLDICHTRGLPLLPAICVNQEGVKTGKLSKEALTGFINGVRRLGYEVVSSSADDFLRKCQEECFAWASNLTRR